MKKIYYLLATMAVLLMTTGCSNEDVIDPDTPGEDMLVFSAGISGISEAVTKADALALTGEDKISNLTVLLFDQTGAYKYGKRVADEAGVNFVGDLEVAPGTYDIILIANTDKDYTAVEGLTLTTLNNNVGDITDQTQDHLLMVSQLYDNIELAPLASDGGYARRTYLYMFEAGDVNSYDATQHPTGLAGVYTGTNAPIVMTRLASRIQLESLSVDFTENLEGASFQLDNVYLVNLRPTTLLTPDGTSYEAGEGYYRGAPATFTVLDGMIAPLATVKEYYAKAYTGVTIDGETPKTFSGTDMFQVYAFENHTAWQYITENKTAYDTRLVIEGVITLEGGQEQPVSYYHVPIKGADFQLIRNKVYGVNVKITSYGYNNPDGRTDGGGDDDPGDDNAKIDVTIKVEDWKVIDQYEEDEEI